VENVNRDGICDGVTEDEVWGQREEAQTFMPLDTSQYGAESGYQVHRQQSIALSPIYVSLDILHTQIWGRAVFYQLRSRVEHVSLPDYRD
jgi:hypothetical protein